MEVIHGQTVEDEVLNIDGKHLIDCTLIGCVLKYSGKDVIFERTSLQGCKHIFYGKARQTVHYLQTVGILDNWPSEWSEISDEVH